ncbi:conserved hypothetical protein [Lodderomyces elongisporus NRRL YB-4239]|uniref:Large ribosomal subunit protein mL46 n=1 Tax=Lodderomyces elongisporus (strain ATCC 11503 / CBS 2605 / JCM 1781 / NBRC 1676 / NRRL YB-4239) TaxID=379508 RepID=A5E2D8_LODEL|nr:conserved hypothetical protein [Lodderomyces elongisporus NRRL YB-4239]
MKSTINLQRIVRLYSTQVAKDAVSPQISLTLILSRLPIITHEPSSFEKQFYKYQSELWRRLMWTFPKWVYFRLGTMAEQRYKVLNQNPVSYDKKIIYPKGKPDLKQMRDRRFRQYIRVPKTYKEEDELIGQDLSEFKESEVTRKIAPNSRVTAADKMGDKTSLERELSRTLYLTVKTSKDEHWKLPNFEERSGEVVPLHLLAEQGLYSIGGRRINYFNVAKTPCHHETYDNENKKSYFIKSHILSGTFEPQTEDLEFQWLTKQELKESLPQTYYSKIHHLLSDI